MSQTNLDLESAYGQFYENLKMNYGAYPEGLRKYEGLSVLMMGVQPGRRMKIPAPGYTDGYEKDVAWSGAHTLGCKIVAPKRHDDKWKFEAFGTMLNSPWVPPGESRDIGSVSGRDEYAQALAGILSPNSVFQTYGGDSGVTAMVMADLLTSKIHREVDPSVSKHLFVFAVGVDGTYVRNLNGLFPDPAPEIAYMFDEYKQLRRKHGIASAATGVG